MLENYKNEQYTTTGVVEEADGLLRETITHLEAPSGDH